MICVKCRGEFSTERNGYRLKTNICDPCSFHKEFGMPLVRNTVFINGYGNESAARIAEIYRREVLPDKKKDGGYYLGRRNEKNKITDQCPNY